MMGLAPETSGFSMKMGMPFFSLVKEKSFKYAARLPLTKRGDKRRGIINSGRVFRWILLMSKMRENIVDRIVQYVKQFLSEEDGVTAIEYGLIAALIAVMIIGGAQLVGENLLTTLNTIATRLTGA